MAVCGLSAEIRTDLAQWMQKAQMVLGDTLRALLPPWALVVVAVIVVAVHDGLQLSKCGTKTTHRL